MATKKATKKVEGTVVSIAFASGETLSADVTAMPDEIKKHLIVHGLSQKLGDSYAGADEKEAYGCAQRVLEGLMKGEWSTRSEGGGSRTSMFLEAIARVLKTDVDDARTRFDAKTEEEQAAIKKHPQVKQALAQIKAERAAAELAAAEKATAGEDTALTL